MYVPEIIEVKNHLDQLKTEGLVKEWELPYENILTRRSAAIFFFTPGDGTSTQEVAARLEQYNHFSVRENSEKKLSQLQYRVTFSEEEKQKNLEKQAVNA